MQIISRNKVLIDKAVQGRLVSRVICYWSVCMLGTFGVLVATPLLISWLFAAGHGPSIGQLSGQAWRIFWPVLFASALVLPLLLLDLVRVSHRFVGPVYRLRSSLRDLADGKVVSPITFRENDFWYDVAKEFNRVADRVRELQPAGKAELSAVESKQDQGSVAV